MNKNKNRYTNENNRNQNFNRNIKKATTTFKQIRLQKQNCEQVDGHIQNKQFNQTLIKSNAIKKLTAMTFQANSDKSKQIVHQLMLDYEYRNKLKYAFQKKEYHQNFNQDQEQRQNQKHYQNHLDPSQSKNIQETNGAYQKSKILILELQNKKLKLKQKMLSKKYRQTKLMQKPENNYENNNKQKNLLKQQLALLEEIKNLKRKINHQKNENHQKKLSNLQVKNYNILTQQKNQQKKKKEEKIFKHKTQINIYQKTQEFIQEISINLDQNKFSKIEELLQVFQKFTANLQAIIE